MSPNLYLIAIPIGHPEDITLRALKVLKSADIVLCEDTRVTGLLFQFHQISTKLQSYHEHNAEQQRPRVIEWLKSGKTIALVSDAGTPLISDPGYKLVKEVREEGFLVTSLPGPCAAITALTLSGLPSDRFYFYGFLPAKSGVRKKALEEIAEISGSIVFYENKNRVSETLADIEEVWGDSPASLARELTKEYEEVFSSSISELRERLAQSPLKGEMVLTVFRERKAQQVKEDQVDPLIKKLLNKHPLKVVVQMVAQETSVSKNRIYERALKLKEQS